MRTGLRLVQHLHHFLTSVSVPSPVTTKHLAGSGNEAATSLQPFSSHIQPSSSVSPIHLHLVFPAAVMVSDSGSSSYPTPTGRPSMWNLSGQRKLSRLYTYTNLRTSDIVKVLDFLGISNTGEAPGYVKPSHHHPSQSDQPAAPAKQPYNRQDSVNKRLNANLDKEPRWLRPKTNSDMSRRIDELANSPIRHKHNPFTNPLGRRRAKSSPSTVPTQEATGPPPLVGDHSTMNPTWLDATAAEAHFSSHLAHWNHPPAPLPAVTTQVASSQAAFTDPSRPMGHPHPHGPALDSASREPMTAQGLLRRTTVMTTSTDMSSNTITDALSQYSTDYVRRVTRLVKRYTLTGFVAAPPTVEEGESVPSETRPTTPDSIRSSWLDDDDDSDHARIPDDTRRLPGDFLQIDFQLHESGPCPPLQEHDSRSCFCYVKEELTQAHWVSDVGLAADMLPIFHNDPSVLAAKINERDPFGNTLLHLLAARGAPHSLLYQVLDLAPAAASVANSAGQTFLHLLGDSWFFPSAGTPPLLSLLHRLNKDPHVDIYSCDVYGRSIFHLLEAKLDETENGRRVSAGIRRHFESAKYRRRDAFGRIPGEAETRRQPRRAGTGLSDWQPPPPPPHSGPPASIPISGDAQGDAQLSTARDAGYFKHARLIEMARRSQLTPNLEDSKGRNGLHCLAAAILTRDTLVAKYGVPPPSPSDPQAEPQPPPQPANSRKRRLNTPHLNKKLCDASNKSLTFRESQVRSMLEAGVDPNHYAADGSTPLMAFVAHLPEDGDYKVPVSILQLLIDGGARLDARNRQGETALHVAVRHGRKLAVRTLVQNGACVHVRDAAGRSLLDVADARLVGASRDEKAYSHYEACRAWLSGKESKAVQNPTVAMEWGPGLEERRYCIFMDVFETTKQGVERDMIHLMIPRLALWGFKRLYCITSSRFLHFSFNCPSLLSTEIICSVRPMQTCAITLPSSHIYSSTTGILLI
ncbi:hypothetical protein ACRALDRAFT_206117 [Sodiomyces alcalophilus JCM 7366]|uniref:uncharacterized protein n=1 Tax=Sodiomyces alcalophilus JCM 7366 TaxID=591952 RepID=UPI0039B62A30